MPPASLLQDDVVTVASLSALSVSISGSIEHAGEIGERQRYRGFLAQLGVDGVAGRLLQLGIFGGLHLVHDEGQHRGGGIGLGGLGGRQAFDEIVEAQLLLGQEDPGPDDDEAQCRPRSGR